MPMKPTYLLPAFVVLFLTSITLFAHEGTGVPHPHPHYHGIHLDLVLAVLSVVGLVVLIKYFLKHHTIQKKNHA